MKQHPSQRSRVEGVLRAQQSHLQQLDSREAQKSVTWCWKPPRFRPESPFHPQDLQAYYDQHRDEYRVPEQVNVSHILIKTPLPGPDGKVDPKGVEEARKKAEDVLKQLKAGGNFAELAKKYSEDPGSGKKRRIARLDRPRPHRPGF